MYLCSLADDKKFKQQQFVGHQLPPGLENYIIAFSKDASAKSNCTELDKYLSSFFQSMCWNNFLTIQIIGKQGSKIRNYFGFWIYLLIESWCVVVLMVEPWKERETPWKKEKTRRLGKVKQIDLGNIVPCWSWLNNYHFQDLGKIWICWDTNKYSISLVAMISKSCIA